MLEGRKMAGLRLEDVGRKKNDFKVSFSIITVREINKLTFGGPGID